MPTRAPSPQQRPQRVHVESRRRRVVRLALGPLFALYVALLAVAVVALLAAGR